VTIIIVTTTSSHVGIALTGRHRQQRDRPYDRDPSDHGRWRGC
jgi:hypothetical protein